jgi:hypothetical protein
VGSEDLAMYKINPALHRFKDEAAIIGRIAVAFAELEYMISVCAGEALGDSDLILKTLYRLKSASARVNAADALMQPTYAKAGLGNEQARMFESLNHCVRIRNQFAHCNFGDHQDAGLFFVDLEKSARAPVGFNHDWKHVDVPLLESQEAWFVHTLGWLFYLQHELPFRRGTPKPPRFPIPTIQSPPPLHNLASQHIPPWLTEDQKVQHLERAKVEEQCAPQPVRPPSVPKLTEEEWRAKEAKDARLAGHPVE